MPHSGRQMDIDDLVLLKIFDYLNLKTLFKCRRVSKTWRNLVNEVLSQRTHLLETFMFSVKFDEPPFVLTKSEFVAGLNKELDKVLAEPAVLVCLLTKRLQLKCILDDQIEATSQTETATAGNRRDGAGAKRQRIASHRNQTTVFALDQLRSRLPRSSKNLYVFTSGVVATDHSWARTLEIEAVNKKELGLGSFFLPRNDAKYRVSLTTIVCDKNFNLIKSKQDLNDYFGVREHEQLKYLFLFVNKSCKIKLEKFFDSLNQIRRADGRVNEHRDNFGFSGGYVDSIGLNSEPTDFNMAFISFITDQRLSSDFKVAHVVIPCVERDFFEETINKKLTALKNTGICDDKSAQLFGIQVCCIGKGKEYHEKENLESSIFRSHFPRVPLVGFFGYGEAGMDFLPNFRGDERPSEPSLSDQDETFNAKWHFYCTIFTIIAVRP